MFLLLKTLSQWYFVIETLANLLEKAMAPHSSTPAWKIPKTAKWSRERDAGMDSYNFGLYGCWVKQATGGLSYVPEEEYTEEILAAQQKAVERNTANIKR